MEHRFKNAAIYIYVNSPYLNTDISKYPEISRDVDQIYLMFLFKFQLWMSETTDISN